ncbi:MAG TPA: hypothetical protein PLA83_09340 [Deltaproteobacteria bacterium]|jgi:hypothetical protein|nr:hypothetical protein [Deltaproteobacteria bacterium]HQI02840.1 hypothetical protein [Deltaproteobacteria bacterium]HQJ08900.1 hypothetical protein [Deltaproteobacteria bacterium]
MTVLWRISLLLIVFMFAAASLPYAAEDSCTKKAAKEPAATVEGKVSFVEPDGTLIVQNEAGKSQIVYLRSDSKITRNGKAAARKSVKTGDVIRARVDSMKTALEVQVLDTKP